MRLKVKKMIIVLLVCVISIEIIPIESINAETIYSGYVKNVSIKRSGNTITVNYTALNVPNGATCYIGYEDCTGTIKKEVFIGKAGRHSIKWKVNATVYRVYTELIARNYKRKSVVKVFHNVSTGKSTHTVTKKEEMNDKISIYAASSVITIAGCLTKKPKLIYGLTVGGLAYSFAMTFTGYHPTKGDYIVTTTSYSNSTENLTTNVKVYKSRESYQKRKKPFYDKSYKTHIGF